MIRFACPTCQKVLSVPPEQAGTKIPCTQCGQRLLVPAPAINQTVMGNLLPAAAQRPAPSAQASDDGWYYSRAGKSAGPVPAEELKRLVAARQLSPDDLVWREGMGQWTPYRSVPGLDAKVAGNAPAGRPDWLEDVRAPADRAAKVTANVPVVQAVKSAPARRTGTRPTSARRPWILLALGGGALCALMAVGGILLVAILLRSPRKDSPVVVQTTVEPKADKPRELSTQEIVARSKPSVALIRHKRGNGTGFVVRPGLVVTNSHVISAALVGQLQVFFPSAEGGKTPLSAELVYEDMKRDIAVLRIRSQAAPLPVAAGYTFAGGEKVIVIGNPGASAGENVTLENAVTQGVMSTSTTLNGLGFYQISCTVNPGNSGGPVFNDRGEVVGVVTRKAVGGRQEGLGFAIPLADLQETIQKAEAQTRAGAEQVLSQHDFGVVFRTLALLGRNYAVVMNHYGKHLDEGRRSGRRAQDSWDQAKAKINTDKLEAVNQFLLEQISPALKRVLSDPSVPRSARDNLDRLLQVYQEMRSSISAPRNIEIFLRKTIDLSTEYDAKVKALKLYTGDDDID